MAQFINDRTDIVTQAIDGLLRHSPHLVRLDGFPHIRVVMRREIDGSKVALVSGGGSGHEPAHAGFIGTGMLTAAVCGDVFASPSVEAVLAGILAVTGEAGCLLIVKNYTGDRLNFGLAAERAKALGKRVEMVVVGDDIALPDLPQPRGVAGTLFVHKIAGAMAESGASLDEVASAARAVAEAAISYGVALDSCTVPGSAKEDRIAAGKAELGLGIHGEPGVRQIDHASAQQTVATVMAGLKVEAVSGARHVALINNLGGTTPLEMEIVARSVLDGSHGIEMSHCIGPAPLMTALDMHGFSVSLLPLNDDWQAALEAATEAPGWSPLVEVSEQRAVDMPDGLEPPHHTPSNDPELRGLIERCCAELAGMETDLNELDAKTGDGDTGSTVAGAAKAVNDALPSLPLADMQKTFSALSDTLARAMGGSSGVLMAIFFKAAADGMEGGSNWQSALVAGVERVSAYGGATVGHRTMIDALDPALRALEADGLAEAAKVARAGADSTARMTRAQSGRSAYLSEGSLDGIADPGAEAVARLFEALAS